MDNVFEMIDAIWKALNARTRRIEELEARLNEREETYSRPLLTLAESPTEAAAGRA